MITKDIIATFILFTRLPLGRICKVPTDSFRRIVAYWPLTGFLTGSVMSMVYLLAVYLNFHAIIAVLLTFTSRLLLTGALHEDGLADFLDGFGGGHTREKTLAIMKDSHTGSFGVLGLTLYVLLWISSVFILIRQLKGNEYILFFTCDIWSKWCASQIINILPYARKEEDCKIKNTYEKTSPVRFIIGFSCAILPFVYILVFNSAHILFLAGAIAPLATMFFLAWYMKRRIRGYTGDCCGAMFLLCELSYILTVNCLWKFF
ncbi:MAG: adenosylcobinamide-GDP ribazoletransferase [Tannerella sp.]|jgi:adenosylcobinamide-GDP ribazoletransferase|nr:adenosylcobinamide-GDP ribazoletransferase [Tannerella sp.]